MATTPLSNNTIEEKLEGAQAVLDEKGTRFSEDLANANNPSTTGNFHTVMRPEFNFASDIRDENADYLQTTTEPRAVTSEREADMNTRLGVTDPNAEQNQYVSDELERIKGEAESIQKELDRRKQEGEATGDTTENGIYGDIQGEIDAANETVLAEVEQASSDFDKLQDQLDSAYRGMVKATKAVYGDRIREMQELNKRRLKIKETIGIRTGRQRYTGELQDGILTNEEIEGIQRVTVIANQLAAALATAQQAKADDDIKLFNQEYDRIEQLRKDGQDQVAMLYKAANDEYQSMIDAKKEERLAAKETQELMVKKAAEIAPAIAPNMPQLTEDPESQAEYISAIAEATGVDPLILLGKVYEAMDAAEKRAMDLNNVQSLINVRYSSENRAQDKYSEELEEKEGRTTLRTAILTDLESGEIDIEIARNTWGRAFPIEEFEKEFSSWIENNEI